MVYWILSGMPVVRDRDLGDTLSVTLHRFIYVHSLQGALGYRGAQYPQDTEHRHGLHALTEHESQVVHPARLTWQHFEGLGPSKRSIFPLSRPAFRSRTHMHGLTWSFQRKREGGVG
jgi:hypothetical protein